MFARHIAAADPSRPAVVMAGSGEVVSFADYEAAADRAAHHLRSLGVGVGDHVAILSENQPRMLLAEAAAERAGVYFTLVNSYLSPEEVAYIVGDCTARVLYASSSKLAVAREAVAQLAEPVACVLLDGEPDEAARAEGWTPWDDAMAGQPAGPIADERIGAPMLYSSGTTGRPKGIFRTVPDQAPGEALAGTQFLQGLWGFREGMVYLNPAPLYHSAPQASVAGALRLGGTVVVMERFDAASWCELVERHRATHCQMVPTMFTRLLKLPEEVRSGTDASSLEVVVHAAAPCPVPVKTAMIEWLGPIVVEYYAATEAHGFTFCTSEEWLAHPGTVGRAIVGALEIRDEHGELCPTG
ncbi:MAG TPA: AMP-binding protein, partial [Acidimicrobiales bacterium]|nr:AMP-binding protein [Acidimicrobiales bacterium]